MVGIMLALLAALLTLWLTTLGLPVVALTIVLGPVAARRGAATSQRLTGRFLPDG
jgi:hypothetical protein